MNLSALRDYAAAQRMFEKALSIRRRVLGEQHPDTLQSYGNVAANLQDMGRPAEAQPLLVANLEGVRHALGEDHPDTAGSYNNLASDLQQQGRYAEAQPYYEKSLEIYRRILGDNHPDVALLLGNVASNLLDAGRPAESLVPARSLVSQLRAGRAAATGRDDAQSLRNTRASTDQFVLLADALWTATPGRRRSSVADEAFQTLQDSIASSAGAAVAQMGARFGSGDNALRRLARERQDLESRLSAGDRALFEALGDTSPGAAARADNLRADTARNRQRIEEIDTELKQRFPEYFDLIRPDALPLAAVQSLLRQGEAMLVVVPGARGTHVVAVSRTQSKWQRANWKAGQVSAAVSRLRCNLDSSRCAGVPATDNRGMKRSDAPKVQGHSRGFDRRTAYELYQQVVAPVMPVLAGARNVYVVTAGALTSLPFSVLVTEPRKDSEDNADPEVLRKTPWLLRQFALTTLPSVASLKALRTFERGATATAAKYDFVGFGDPVLGAGTGPTAGRGPTRAASMFGSVATNGAGLADPQALRESFGPLPGTKAELEAMEKAFAPRAEILLGPQATESSVKTTTFDGVRVIAFSTHGLVAGDIDGIAEPGLVLTPPTTATADDDGLLTATEVAQLKLSADWVLLSACNTASSDGTPGADSLSGLARAFFYAGARSLLVSHWPVRDDVASRLTVDAIRREREHPELGRAEALRQATLAVLESSNAGDASLAQPAAWAPFSLVGEGY